MSFGKAFGNQQGSRSPASRGASHQACEHARPNGRGPQDIIGAHFIAEDRSAAIPSGETVSVYDELGVNLDTDSQGRLTRMEILGGREIVAQLEERKEP